MSEEKDDLIVVCRFGVVPNYGVFWVQLENWDPEVLDAAAYESPRAKALYAALGVDNDDWEYVLVKHRSEDRWGLVGPTGENMSFAVEAPRSEVGELL